MKPEVAQQEEVDAFVKEEALVKTINHRWVALHPSI
jgi:hypothetical protein